MAEVTVPIFRRILDAWGIRESVALTKVDLGRAIPVLPLDQAVISERATYRSFVHLSTQVAAAEIALDARSANNWDAIIEGPNESALPVPADHDYRIVGIGGASDTTMTFTYVRRFTPLVGPTDMMLWFAANRANEGQFNADGPTIQNLPSAFFQPVVDTSAHVLFVSLAGDVTFSIQTISAPRGLLKPY